MIGWDTAAGPRAGEAPQKSTHEGSLQGKKAAVLWDQIPEELI